MKSDSPRWIQVTESGFPWEAAALRFLRERMPDADPWRVWANFEFIGLDGSINEVDALVLSPRGLTLVEIKNWGGEIRAEGNVWTRFKGGRPAPEDNPLLLANKKAKRFKSYLESKLDRRDGLDLPFVSAAIFLADTGVKFVAGGTGDTRVFFQDGQKAKGGVPLPGIVEYLAAPDPVALREGAAARVDGRISRDFHRLMQRVGIERARKYQKVGDFDLKSPLDEGPGWQDWLAEHSTVRDLKRRVRCYLADPSAGREFRQTLQRAAEREVRNMLGIEHRGILVPVDFKQGERGPCVVYPYDPDSMRLDHWLEAHGKDLIVDRRVDFVRQLAEAVRYAHGKGIFHRALSPRSVLVVEKGQAAPVLRIMDWQMASRVATAESTSGHKTATATEHLDRLIEDGATLYMAPEIVRGGTVEAAGLGRVDVFSLGALTYRIFAGCDPAPDLGELQARLARDKGLELSGAMNGASQTLQDLVSAATQLQTVNRTASVDEFLLDLERYEEELTDPDREAVTDPLEARPEDRLPGGWVVKSRLGVGSTAAVLKVAEPGGKGEVVLKIALDPNHNGRLEGEAEVLAKLRHDRIVASSGTTRIGNRVAIKLSLAGTQTLGARLRTAGPLQPTFLARWGEDLLDALEYLEDNDVPHRDVKPDNLGVQPFGKNDELRLVLFDFSLARTPRHHLQAGTPRYLDPFLPARRRWDAAADRWSAALTLYEMATGTLPLWGAPSGLAEQTEDEATLEAERFDPALRDGLKDFFARALRRDAALRFPSAKDMRGAWVRVFEVRATSAAEAAALRARAKPGTPLAELGFSADALAALARLGPVDVAGLVATGVGGLTGVAGVSQAVRHEIRAAWEDLAARFPPPAGAKPSSRRASKSKAGAGAGAGPPAGPRPGSPGTGPAGTAPTPGAAPSADAPGATGERGLDAILVGLLPAATSTGKTHKALRFLMGIDPMPGEPDSVWPTQKAAAAAAKVSQPPLSVELKKAAEAWRQRPRLDEIRAELDRSLEAQGGIGWADELAETLLAAHGTGAEGAARGRQARALVRIAIEAEGSAPEPRWDTRRIRGHLLLARATGLDPQAALDYADRLGQEADRLAGEDPLPSVPRIQETLRALPAPEGLGGLPDARRVRLAAAAGARAAVSSRLELYPRGMDPVRALKLSQGALAGVPKLSAEQIRTRVASRYPEAAPLPDRPELDALLKDAGLELEWSAAADEGRGAYLPPAPARLLSTSFSTLTRRATALDELPAATPEVAAARELEARLDRSVREGGFLALAVAPKGLTQARDELAKRFEVQVEDLDRHLIRALKETAARRKVSWQKVQDADLAPPESRDGQNLRRLVHEAVGGLAENLGSPGRVLLLTHPGLLARYGELGLIAVLKERIGTPRPEGPPRLHGLWVLTACDAQDERPSVDGTAIPVLTRAEWARIPDAWVKNLHRAGGAA